MTDVKFSDFPNADNASYPTPVGLQSGANVQLPANALARAIQDAIATNVPFNFTGAITAANLSGTNTGDQIAATVPYTPGNVPAVTNVQDAIDYVATHGSVLNWPSDVRKAPQKVAVTPGLYGDATHVSQFRIDKFGRVIYAVSVAIQSASSTQPGFISAADFNSIQSTIHAACGGI